MLSGMGHFRLEWARKIAFLRPFWENSFWRKEVLSYFQNVCGRFRRQDVFFILLAKFSKTSTYFPSTSLYGSLSRDCGTALCSGGGVCVELMLSSAANPLPLLLIRCCPCSSRLVVRSFLFITQTSHECCLNQL